MDIGQRQPLQELGGATSRRNSKLSIILLRRIAAVERHYRVCLRPNHRFFPCSAFRVEDVRRRVARSRKSGTDRPKQFSIDEAEQEDADASLHWTRGDYTARTDVEGQRACKCASRFYQSAEAYGG
jgi:hypothetical protein